MTIEEAKRQGYCIVSRKYRIASRIDRPDWREHCPESNNDADLYRRCYSKDNIFVPSSFVGKLKSSNNGYPEFRGK